MSDFLAVAAFFAVVAAVVVVVVADFDCVAPELKNVAAHASCLYEVQLLIVDRTVLVLNTTTEHIANSFKCILLPIL